MKKIAFIIFFIGLSQSFAQKLKFHVTGQKDTIVHLCKYNGSKLYYADTAEMKGGIVEFNGKKQKPGMLALLLPGQKYFDFVYNSEEVELETSGPEYFKNLVVKKSVENKLFVTYMNYLAGKRDETGKLVEEQKPLKDSNPKRFEEIGAKIKQISDEVAAYQKEVIEKNPTTFVAKIIKMSMDIEIPPAPKDKDGKITDSSFQYRYYRDHFFDNFDLKDNRIVGSPLYQSKLELFFGNTMMIQHPDSILKYGYRLIDGLDPLSDVYEFTTTWMMTFFEKSKIMGMDKVWIKIAEKYICKKNANGKYPAFWMQTDKIEEFCGKVDVQKNLVIGTKATNIILKDTSDKIWKDFYSLKSEYTILYFWSPECGHCKVSTPKLQKLYAEKLKARNVEVFAVTSAIGKDFESWKKFIRENKLTFINVGLTESLYKIVTTNASEVIPKYTTLESVKYDSYYDIVSTPRIFLLDKDKKIIAKQLSISQLEDFLDAIQKVKNAPKIIPEDPKDKEESH